MTTINRFALASALLLAASTRSYAEAPKVIASFKPIHSLVAAVMKGIGEPYLLVKGSASPHTYAMTASDAEALQNADAIFWVNRELEAFLEKPLESLGGKAKIVELSEIDGLTKLEVREGGAFDQHADDIGKVEAPGEAEIDNHLWFDPNNAKAFVREIARTLSENDPQDAATYNANAEKLIKDLDALTKELVADLAPVKGKPIIVFHDAYQYFEKAYGVTIAGSVTVNPDTSPGAERIAELRAKVKELGAVCIFAEPNFDPKIIAAITEGSSAKTGVLDPEAAALTEGPELYFQSLRGIAKSMKTCLAP